MNCFINRVVLAALFVFSGAVVHAQPKPPVPLVHVELKAVAFGRGITDLGFIQQGKKTPLYVPSFGLSLPRTYHGPQEFEFLQTQTIEGVKKEVPVAKVTLPLDLPRALLVFIPMAKEPGKFGTLVVPYSETDAPANTARFMNYTGRTVPISMNNNRQLLENGKTIVVPLVKGQVKVFIPRVKKTADDAADICRETYSAPAGGRLTLLLTPPVGGGFADNDEALVIVPLADEPPPTPAAVKPVGNQ
jgi:hypothetical protein